MGLLLNRLPRFAVEHPQADAKQDDAKGREQGLPIQRVLIMIAVLLQAAAPIGETQKDGKTGWRAGGACEGRNQIPLGQAR
jgi:hypothetical protein